VQGFPLAITPNANFTANQTDGRLTSVSALVKRGHTIGIVHARVYGVNEKLIADVITNDVLSE
jgi:butyrate kinase